MTPEFRQLFEQHISLWIAGAIIVLGLLIYGLRDVLRFSLVRAWAISGVCFAESIRRRVLWITPLAIFGVLIVSQLQKPLDEQDAIRQTIKFCLFATGLVVTVTAIILACTNLPREIDNRVIYTIVTKPTTRLEIVVGKTLGFARVSAAILLIMGLFSFAYLHLRAWTLKHDIAERLRVGAVDAASRPTLEYWSQAGLLTSRTFQRPREMGVFARAPEPGDLRRWMYAGEDESFVVPFQIRDSDLIPADAPPDAPPGATGVLIRLKLGYLAHLPQMPEYIAAPGPATAPAVRARASVQILDDGFSPLITGEQINDGNPLVLSDPTGSTPVGVYVKPEAAANLVGRSRLFVEVAGATPGVEYFVDASNVSDPERQPLVLLIPGATQKSPTVIIPPPIDPENPNRRFPPIFRGRMGTFGQQLRGGPPDQAPLAVMTFSHRTNESQIAPINGRVPFELRVGVERSGDEQDEAATQIQLVIVNRDTGLKSEPLYINPESNRTSYFTMPAEAVQGGNFDVHLRNLTTGNYIGLQQSSLALVASEQSFNINLLKSLAILWLLTILVVIISIFCSTFLSWPIAIVLTLVILLGNWAVMQLGADTGPGIGHTVASDLGFRDPSVTKTVSTSVEALTRFLNAVARILPDISQFSAVEDIERGVTISLPRLIAPLQVLALFGLPMLVLAYVILRNKEVAP